MRYLMGIDNGGTFSKAAIFDAEGNQVAVASEPTETLTPKPGYTERNMTELWEVNARVIRTAILQSGVDPRQIAGVSFSGHGKGLYLVGEDGLPAYNGILSTDTRAWEYPERWKADGTAKRVFEKTFQDILACQPVSLLAWLRDHRPGVLERTRHIFMVKDYIRFMLTGEAFLEYTDTTGGNLVNLSTGEYDRELMALFGLEGVMDRLPPLRRSHELCGRVTQAASEKTLLAQGTPVAAGMFDVDACGIASGLCSEQELCMVAGTWAINEFLSRQPVTNGTVALNSYFCIPGYYLVEESSPTSAGNMEWFIRRLMAEEKAAAEQAGGSVYELTNEWVASIDPADSQVIFLPFLNGSNDDPLAKGAFVGLTGYHTKKHMLRAVYEGVAFSHRTHVERLLQNRQRPKSVRLAGGAARSEVWVQIFADVLGFPVDVVEGKELGAQGAAMAAGVAVGLYGDYDEAIRRTVRLSRTVYPRQEYRAVYEEKYAAYREIIGALRGVWRRLSNEK